MLLVRDAFSVCKCKRDSHSVAVWLLQTSLWLLGNWKEVFERPKKAKEMNGKDQCLGWMEGKKGGFYVKDKCVIILLLSLIKTWLVSKTAAVFVLNHCHKCFIICNNSSCPEHLKKKVVLESSLFVIILMIKLCTCYQCKYTTRINNHLRHMPQRWSLLKLQFGNQLFFPHSCVQTFWNSQTSNLSLLISSVF